MLHGFEAAPRQGRRMQVHQILTALSYGDAIGDDTLAIQRILREAGYESDIFCQLYHPRMANFVRKYEDYPKISSPEHVVVFHFSIGSPVSHMVPHLPDRKILIYHNITPMHFFLDTNLVLARLCHSGRKELRAFADRVDLALGDSEYNRRELEELGFARTGVLPIIMDFSKFDRPSPTPRRLHGDDGYTFLFVGRVIPNKKIEDVIRVFHLYQRHINPQCRVFIVGDHRGFERYYWSLKDFVHQLGVRKVVFSGHVTNEEIAAYYRMSDVFLCMSEHEGFCVPLIEAFHFDMPVIAFASSAVPYTLRDAGVLFDDKDFAAMAEMAELLRIDSGFREQVLQGQREVLADYHPSNTGRMLIDFIEQVKDRR
ncbi:MAG: glycosyltransferase family 4 protein [Acidobacteriota bacterium]